MPIYEYTIWVWVTTSDSPQWRIAERAYSQNEADVYYQREIASELWDEIQLSRRELFGERRTDMLKTWTREVQGATPMTQPVEDVEKLAKRLFVACSENRLWVPASGKEAKFAYAVLPILRAHFATRDAELQRLRELLQESITHLETRANHARYMADNSKWQADQDTYTNIANATCGLLTKIESALHPNHQEPKARISQPDEETES